MFIFSYRQSKSVILTLRMLYFFQNRPGPVAPIDWVRDCIQTLTPDKSSDRSKILLGLNFYGMDYRTGGGTRK